MNESRVFMLNGTEVSGIVTRLENFFRTEKGMGGAEFTDNGRLFMQASQPKDGWKTLTGMRLAITVQMTVMGDKLNVSIGEGQWSDKIGQELSVCLSRGRWRSLPAWVLSSRKKLPRRGVSGDRRTQLSPADSRWS